MPDLPDETEVWRRIPPSHFPKKPGVTRPDSDAFKDNGPDDFMSVVIVRDGRDPQEFLAGFEGFGLVKLTVGDLREYEQEVVLDTDPDREDPDHAFVCGPKRRPQVHGMAKAAEWVVPPPVFP